MSTTTGAAIDTAGRIAASLPGQFLALVMLNTIFIGGLLWFLERQQESRDRAVTGIIGPMLAACTQEIPADLLRQRDPRRGADPQPP